MSQYPNSRTWIMAHHDEPQAFSFCGGTAFAFSRTSPNKSTDNEDSAAFVELGPSHGVLVVADGMGGAASGDRAAKCVIESLVESLVSADVDGETSRSQILDSIESANTEILSWGIGAGSTLIAVEFLNETIRAFHVGDATALSCSNRGRTKFSTIAHSPVAMAVEAGLLDEDEALMHEDRHLISNFVGSTEMKIELGPVLEMASRDTLVLGSDGLFDNLTMDEIVETIKAGGLQQQATLLVNLARDRMNTEEDLPSKPDDLTVICFRQSV